MGMGYIMQTGAQDSLVESPLCVYTSLLYLIISNY